MSYRCDNMAVVAIVNFGRCKMDRAMHLMRCLSFFLARWDVTLVCQHISDKDNGATDALSRDSLVVFQQLVPESAEESTQIPEERGSSSVWSETLRIGPKWTG